jgi:hypothetical protein
MRRVLGWGALGVGGIGIITGTVLGVMAMNDRSTLSGRGCNLDQNTCPPERSDDVDSYNRRLTISSVGFIGGGILAGAGAVLLLTAPKAEQSFAIRIQPSNVTLSGAF